MSFNFISVISHPLCSLFFLLFSSFFWLLDGRSSSLAAPLVKQSPTIWMLLSAVGDFTLKMIILSLSNDTEVNQIVRTRNMASCYYLCCCPCMGLCVPIAPDERQKILVNSCPEHFTKWIFCHPCYIAQSLRFSKKVNEFTEEFTDMCGAPDCEDMER